MLLPGRRQRRRGRTPWGFDLLESLRADRCAVCALALRSLNRFFDGLSYEHTNDPELRERFVKGGGFCRDHAWYYADRWRDGLSIALLYRHLLHQAQRDGGLAVGHDCMACEQREAAELDLGVIFQDELRRPDFRAALPAAMLCVRHARLILDRGLPATDQQVVAQCLQMGRACGQQTAAGAQWLGGALVAGQVAAIIVPSTAPGGCPVCLAGKPEQADWAVMCNPHIWDRLSAGGVPPNGSWERSQQPAGCPDCRYELALASSAAQAQRCLNHTRTHAEAWRAATGWIEPLLGQLDQYIRTQDYRFLNEADGAERGAQWEALYWTVGATRRSVTEELLPRLGLGHQRAG